MNVLLIHQFFLRDGEAGGSRFNDMVAVWRNEGHHVTVLAGDVHYQTGQKSDRKETSDAAVVRVRASAHGHRSKTQRIRSYASFAYNASRMLDRVVRPDVVIASSPSLPVVIPGMAAKAKWDVPLVFEVRDLWPESAITTGVIPKSSWIANASYALEELGYETADHIVALTPAIKDDIVQRRLASPDAISVIPNGVDVESIRLGDRESLREEMGWTDKFVVLYAGAHGIANHLETLLQAAEAGRQRDPSIHFVTVGDGPLKRSLERQAAHLGNVEFVGAVPKEQIYRYIHAADAGAAILQKNKTFRTVYPNKIFDYMAVERPVICAIEGAASELVERYDVGECVPAEDGVAILNAALQLRDRNRSFPHARAVIEQDFNRVHLALRYQQLLQDLVDG